jgi:predicted restriction endonuclease
MSKILYCSNCNKEFIRKNISPKTRHFYCSKECRGKSNNILSDKQLKELTVLDLYKHYNIKNRISGFSKIRNLNRKWNRHLLNNGCNVCGYRLHVELAHIKPLKDFDLMSKLCDINDESNNLALCPNHHWEFDNGLLELGDFLK